MIFVKPLVKTKLFLMKLGVKVSLQVGCCQRLIQKSQKKVIKLNLVILFLQLCLLTKNEFNVLGFIKIQKIKFYFFFVFLFLFSCGQNYQPKPKGFQKYNLPTPKHETITVSNYYLFEKNKLAKPDLNKELNWLNLSYKNSLYPGQVPPKQGKEFL